MSTNLTTHELAQRAALLLEDPAMKEAFRILYERNLSTWKNSKPEDSEARERAFYTHRALADIEAQLRSLVDAPKVKAFNKRGQG